MSRLCMVCGKIPQKGRLVSHSNRKSNRQFLPNLQSVRLSHGQNTKSVKLCSRCLRTVKGSIKATPPAVEIPVATVEA